MVTGLIFWIVASIVCSVAGIVFIREWYCSRLIDVRPFSWKRWFNKDEGLSPREKLVNGIICITVGLFATVILIFPL